MPRPAAGPPAAGVEGGAAAAAAAAKRHRWGLSSFLGPLGDSIGVGGFASVRRAPLTGEWRRGDSVAVKACPVPPSPPPTDDVGLPLLARRRRASTDASELAAVLHGAGGSSGSAGPVPASVGTARGSAVSMPAAASASAAPAISMLGRMRGMLFDRGKAAAAATAAAGTGSAAAAPSAGASTQGTAPVRAPPVGGAPARPPRPDPPKRQAQLWRSVWHEALALERLTLEGAAAPARPGPERPGWSPGDGLVCGCVAIGEDEGGVALVMELFDGLDAVAYVRRRAEAEAERMREAAEADGGEARRLQQAGHEDVVAMAADRGRAVRRRPDFGHSLYPRPAAGGLPLAEARRLGGMLLRAVARCHRAGIAHRDLKPDNVMLCGVAPGPTRPGGPALDPESATRTKRSSTTLGGLALPRQLAGGSAGTPQAPPGPSSHDSEARARRVGRAASQRMTDLRHRRRTTTAGGGPDGGKACPEAEGLALIDFGLAHVEPGAAGPGQLDGLRTLVGTLWAAPPEVWRKERPYSGAAADAWGLGVVLYWLLFGASPYRPGQPVTLAGIGKMAKDGAVMAPPGGWPDETEGAAAMRGAPAADWAAACGLVRAFLRPAPAERLSVLEAERSRSCWLAGGV